VGGYHTDKKRAGVGGYHTNKKRAGVGGYHTNKKRAGVGVIILTKSERDDYFCSRSVDPNFGMKETFRDLYYLKLPLADIPTAPKICTDCSVTTYV
jgi:hypothetical protein